MVSVFSGKPGPGYRHLLAHRRAKARRRKGMISVDMNSAEFHFGISKAISPVVDANRVRNDENVGRLVSVASSDVFIIWGAWKVPVR